MQRKKKCAHRRNCATARLTSGAPFDEAHLRPPDGAITAARLKRPSWLYGTFWPIDYVGRTPCADPPITSDEAARERADGPASESLVVDPVA